MNDLIKTKFMWIAAIWLSVMLVNPVQAQITEDFDNQPVQTIAKDGSKDITGNSGYTITLKNGIEVHDEDAGNMALFLSKKVNVDVDVFSAFEVSLPNGVNDFSLKIKKVTNGSDVSYSVLDGDGIPIGQTGTFTATTIAYNTFTIADIDRTAATRIAFELSNNLSSYVDDLSWTEPVAVTDVILSTDAILNKLEMGATAQMSASVLPEDAVDRSIKWSVDNTSFATIDESTGVLTSVSLGTVTVRATNEASSVFGELDIEVIEAGMGYEKGETFDNVTLTINGDGAAQSVVGTSGITYTQGLSTKPADDGILTPQNSLMIRQNNSVKGWIEFPLTNGVDDFTFSYKRAFTSGAPSISYSVGGNNYTSSATGGEVMTVSHTDLDIQTSATLRIELTNATAFLLDDLAWTEPTVSGPIAVSSITVSSDAEMDEVEMGGGTQMSADVLPANATDKSINWSVDASGHATIDESTGVLTAVSEGDVVVTATNEASGVNGELTITVVAAVETYDFYETFDNVTFSIDGDGVAKEVEGTSGVTYTQGLSTKPADDKAISGANAIMIRENKTVKGYISFPLAKGVDNLTFSYVSAFNIGAVDIAYSVAGNDYTASLPLGELGTITLSDLGFEYATTLTIELVNSEAFILDDLAWTEPESTLTPVTSVVVSSAAVSGQVEVGESVQMLVEVLPENASEKTIAWSVDNESIATIDANGVITGVSAGIVVVTALNEAFAVAGTLTLEIAEEGESFDGFESFDNVTFSIAGGGAAKEVEGTSGITYIQGSATKPAGANAISGTESILLRENNGERGYIEFPLEPVDRIQFAFKTAFSSATSYVKYTIDGNEYTAEAINGEAKTVTLSDLNFTCSTTLRIELTGDPVDDIAQVAVLDDLAWKSNSVQTLTESFDNVSKTVSSTDPERDVVGTSGLIYFQGPNTKPLDETANATTIDGTNGILLKSVDGVKGYLRIPFRQGVSSVSFNYVRAFNKTTGEVGVKVTIDGNESTYSTESIEDVQKVQFNCLNISGETEMKIELLTDEAVSIDALIWTQTDISEEIPTEILQVAVDLETTQWTISEYLVGMHNVYYYDADSIYEQSNYAQWLKESGVSTMRYPGGSVVKYWDWENPTGTARGDRYAPDWDGYIAPEENWMSLDEYLDIIDESGIKPLIGVNITSGFIYDDGSNNLLDASVERAADQVQHVIDRGHTGAFYYLGNEGGFSDTGNATESEANSYLLHAVAMKAIDPTVKLMFNHNNLTPDYLEQFLTYTFDIDGTVHKVGDYVDIVETHGKWPYGSDPDGYEPATIYEWQNEFPLQDRKNGTSEEKAAGGRIWRETLVDLRTRANDLGYPDIKFANNEYGHGVGTRMHGFERYSNSLLAIDFLQELFIGNWYMSCFWSTVKSTEDESILSFNNNRYNPMHFGFEMLAEAQGAQMLGEISTGSKSVYGFAAQKEGEYLVYLINKSDYTRNVELDFQYTLLSNLDFYHGISMVDSEDGFGLSEEAFASFDVDAGVFMTTLPAMSYTLLKFGDVHSVTFTVSDTDGAIEKAKISIDGREVYTNSEGKVSFALSEGSYDYEVSADGFQAMSGSVVKDQTEQSVSVTLQPVPQFKVKFVVKDANSVIEGATIIVNNESFQTDANGEVVLELYEGSYTFIAEKLLYEDQEGSITVAADQTVEVSLVSRLTTVTDINSHSVQSLIVYPNPTEGMLYLSGLDLGSNYSYKVTDLAGRVQTRGDLRGNTSIDLSQLSKGYYHLVIHQAGGGSATKKIVIE